MVTDIQNDDIYFCKAKSKTQAIMKAQRFWNDSDPYCEFNQVEVKEVSEREYMKYVGR